MNDESIKPRVLHLSEVENLTQRQIAEVLGISRHQVQRIIKGHAVHLKPKTKELILKPYWDLISQWYHQYPLLKAIQVYERLLSYGFTGGYNTVKRFTRKYRRKKTKVYHPLSFLPGEEAQVDWMVFTHPTLGRLYGFIYVLAYSRYAWGVFYPKTTFEFFLSGHITCFEYLKGLPRRHRYDNIKSVVIKRQPSIEYNSQFLDFARFFGFSIHLCNPYRGNEKGRVERLIRDIRVFLNAENFSDINDLNKKFHQWLKQRNEKIHRTTQKTPAELLLKEHLKGLPQNEYPARRQVPGVLVSKTALVEFETNKYSVPGSCAGKTVTIMAFADKIEIYLQQTKVAIHKRCFDKRQIFQNPLHAEQALKMTPQFKRQRILQLINSMGLTFATFIDHQDSDEQRYEVAYQLFQLLKTHSKAILSSALRELNAIGCYKIKGLQSLLNLPESKEGDPLWPQNKNLLNLDYEQRSLEDYDPDTESMDNS